MSAAADARCRSCRMDGLQPVIDFGPMPLADRLVEASEIAAPEPRYPLAVAWCPHCSLLQILAAPPPEVLFDGAYLYLSSVSEAYVGHARRFAADIIRRRDLGPGHRVVEIASNDGYLLRHFMERGIAVMGFEPSPAPAAAAERAGVPTRRAFFTADLAVGLSIEGLAADLIVANNVLAHVPDPNDLVAAIAGVLRPGGMATFEFPYVRDLVENLEFDTIYHEHHCYFSLRAVDALIARNGLQLVDVERLTIHGGSLRVFAVPADQQNARPSPAVAELLGEERTIGLQDGSMFEGFSERVHRLTVDLKRTLAELRAGGARIAAYGAAAKGATLLNAAGIDRALVDFVVDRNPIKQRRFMPGIHLEVLSPSALLEHQPDYVLLLTWNFAEEIFAQQAEYLSRGGSFIVPVPEVRFHPGGG
jgi:SAM-dependent methyltransferase